MTQTQADNVTVDPEVKAFVDAGIASGNIDMMKGIAETVTDLSAEQIEALLLAGSLDVVQTIIATIDEATDTGILGDINSRVLTPEQAATGLYTITVLNQDGTLIPSDPGFSVVKASCDIDEVILQSTNSLARLSMDNICATILGTNMDKLDLAAVTAEDIINALKIAILSNITIPTDIVTEYLTDDSDTLRAKAYVNPNTDNATIIEEMTRLDAEGTNIDAFKLAMISDLNTDTMLQGNIDIVIHLLGGTTVPLLEDEVAPLIPVYLTQSTPVQFAMFKNYMLVLATDNGTVIDGIIGIEDLINTYVG